MIPTSITACVRDGARRLCRQLSSSFAILLAVGLSMLPATVAPQILSKTARADPAPVDPYGRGTPRELAAKLLQALGSGADTSRYFELSDVPAHRRTAATDRYTRRLRSLLDGGGTITAVMTLSDRPAGRTNDDLPVNQDVIGSVPTRGGADVPIVARAAQEDGVIVWRVSSAFLRTMPNPPITATWRTALPAVLSTYRLLGAPLADWLLLAAIGAVTYLSIRLLFVLALAVLARFKRDQDVRAVWLLVDAASAPLSTVITFAVFLAVIAHAGVSIVARALIGQIAGAIFAVAFLWLFWRVIDVGADIVIGRMDRAERRRAKSAVLFARRIAKMLLIAAAAIVVLATVGINVTAGIAALGLGGVALALGAQKTIENLVGSVSVIADELVRVGDTCRIGDVTGVVEEIGIRSTRIRTSERTRVSIPNGNLAAMQVENYAARDRILFETAVTLPEAMTAASLEHLLGDLREVIGDMGIFAGKPRAHLRALGTTGPEIVVTTYLDTTNPAVAAAYREQVLFAVLRTVENVRHQVEATAL